MRILFTIKWNIFIVYDEHIGLFVKDTVCNVIAYVLWKSFFARSMIPSDFLFSSLFLSHIFVIFSAKKMTFGKLHQLFKGEISKWWESSVFSVLHSNLYHWNDWREQNTRFKVFLLFSWGRQHFSTFTYVRSDLYQWH